VNVGIAGGQDPHRTMAYASVNIPLGGKACKEVAATRKMTMEYQLAQMKIEQRKADVLFSAKMANMCIQIDQTITITADNPLYMECAQYVASKPAPNELSKINQTMGRYGGTIEELSQRLGTLEQVAHRPNETFLLKE